MSSEVSEFCLPLLFADDTNLFITCNDTKEMCARLNGDLQISQNDCVVISCL